MSGCLFYANEATPGEEGWSSRMGLVSRKGTTRGFEGWNFKLPGLQGQSGLEVEFNHTASDGNVHAYRMTPQ